MASNVSLYLLASIVTVFLYIRKKRSPLLPLPPGPHGYPVIGNVYDIPQEYAWIAYSKWAKKYGNIMHFNIFGTHTIILNSIKSATDLLDKKSFNYSDKPRMVMANEVVGWDWDFAHMPYAEIWRRHRKCFHQYFQPRNLVSYHPIQRKVTINLLERLLQTPEKFSDHVKQHSSSVVLTIAYGYEVQAENDFYIMLHKKAVEPLQHVVHAGAYVVDYIPALKYLPKWFPGADFKKNVELWATNIRAVVDKPYEMVKQEMADGVAKRSFVNDNLDKLKVEGKLDEEEEKIVKNCAGMIYHAGSDTTASLMRWWLLAMAKYPDIQRKAQAELDNVIGKDRLPDFNDRPSMPYLEAMLKETLRWGTVTPLAVPHSALQEDVYEGYRIPAKSTVVVNVWAIMHDEKIYPEPFKFRPERFIPGDNKADVQMDPIVAGAFGYGRRICPGRHLAMDSVWFAMAAILSLFDVSKPVGDSDKGIEFTDGLVSKPKSFQIKITPRSEATQNLIDNVKLEINTVAV